MALQIEQVGRDTGPQRTPLAGDRTRVVVRPGDAFRIVDDTGQPIRPPALRVRRLDNSLIVDGLPGGKEVELNNFFGACRPGAECRLSLQGLGAPPGTIITEESPPAAALTDGSFLLYGSDGGAAAAAIPAVTVPASEGPSWGMIGAAVGGLLAVGAAAAGGGGGKGDGGASLVDTTPPAAPVVTSGAVLKGSAPVVTGTAEAGSRVTLRVDVNGNGFDASDPAWIVTVAADGSWSVDLRSPPASGALPASGLADGQVYVFEVRASDAALNVSPVTRTSLSVDSRAPSAPVINTVAGDDIVNAAERAQGVTVSGTAEAGSTVAVTLGGATVAGVANASGAWSVVFQPGQLPADGIAAIQAVATDPAGNASPAATRQLLLETTVPGAPTITDNVAGTATGPVLFTVTFSRPVTGITAADFVVQGGTPGAFTAVSPTVYTLAVTPTAGVQSGQIVLQLPAAAGQDAAGNPTAAATSIQAYDTAPPTATIVEDAPAIARGPITFTITFSEAVTGFTASDLTVTGVPASAVTGFAGSGTTYTVVVTPPANATGTISVGVPAGAAIDAVQQGNVATAPVAVQFDTQAPTLVAIEDPVAGTANGPVTFTFRFSEPVLNFERDDIVLTGGAGTLVVTPSAAASTTHTATYTPAPGEVGTVTLSVGPGRVDDPAGNPNVGTVSTTQAFDLAAPAAPTLALAPASDTGTPGDNLTADDTPTIVVSFGTSGPTGAAAGDTVRIALGGVTVGTAVLGAGEIAAGSVSITTATLGTGPGKVLTATIVDAAGNASAASAPLTLTIVAVLPTPGAPDLVAASDTGASGTDNVTSDTTPTFTVGALPAGAVNALLFVGGVQVAATYSAGALTPNAPLAATGVAQNVTVAWVDSGGNVSAQSAPLAVTIDTTAPAAPGAAPDLLASSDTGASNTDNLTDDTTPSFAIGALPAGATGAQLFVDGTAVGATLSGGTLTVTSPLALGATPRSFTYAFVDDAGNVSAQSAPLSVRIDNVGPDAPTSAPDLVAASDTGASSTDNVTSDTTPTFVVGAFPTGVVAARLYVGGTEVASTYSAAGGGTLTPNGPLAAPGTPQDVTFAWVDGGGRVSGQSPALAVTIDTAAPNPTFTFTVTDDGAVAIPHNNAPASTDTTPTSRLTLSSVLGTGETLTLVLDTTTIQTFTAASPDPGPFTPGGALATGVHFYSASITDLAGNVRTVDLSPGDPLTDTYTITVI